MKMKINNYHVFYMMKHFCGMLSTGAYLESWSFQVYLGLNLILVKYIH